MGYSNRNTEIILEYIFALRTEHHQPLEPIVWFDANDLDISVSATNALVAVVVYICSKRLQLTVGLHDMRMK